MWHRELSHSGDAPLIPKVLISVPNTGWMHKHVTVAVLKLLSDRRVRSTVIFPTWVPYEHNLNRIAEDMLDKEYDVWLNIDSDNPPINNPLDLLDLDLDVVGCPTPQYHFTGKEGERPVYWVACDRVPEGYKEHDPKSGLQEVDAVGSGCWMVRRRVLLSISQPIFERVYDNRGRVDRGPDFRFCEKAKEVGFRVWAHYDYPCRHFKEVELTEAMQAFHGIR